MIRFIGTSLQLQSITGAHTLNSIWTTSVWRISMKNLSLISDWFLVLWSLYRLNLTESESYVMASQPMCLGIKHTFGAYDQIFISLWQLRACFSGAPTLTRGRVCLLYTLLAFASVVFFGSESLWTRDHILLSQIWGFPFRRLLWLAAFYCLNSRIHCFL
jgi:hypothetical protein